MANTRKVLQEGYSRLKKTLDKLLKPDQKKVQPQLVLQPVRDKKHLRNTPFH